MADFNIQEPHRPGATPGRQEFTDSGVQELHD